MKAALINGSPKVNVDGSDSSVSYEMLQIAKRYLRRRHVHNMEEFHIKTGILGEKEMERLMECDVWLFSFPVYSSGVPSHLLSVLMEIEKYLLKIKSRKDYEEKMIHIYAIANGGLFEGTEARFALEVIEHWCVECGLLWGSAIGLGGSPAITRPSILPFGIRRWRSLGRAMNAFSLSIASGMSTGFFYCSPDISKKAYVNGLNRFYRRKKRESENETMII